MYAIATNAPCSLSRKRLNSDQLLSFSSSSTPLLCVTSIFYLHKPYLYIYIPKSMYTYNVYKFKCVCIRGLSRAQGAEERSMDKQQASARQLGKTPYRDVLFCFQAAAGVLAAPVEREALAVVVARCTGTTHKTPRHVCRSLADGQPG